MPVGVAIHHQWAAQRNRAARSPSPGRSGHLGLSVAHEVDLLGVAKLAGADQVSFVFPVFIVDHHHHSHCGWRRGRRHGIEANPLIDCALELAGACRACREGSEEKAGAWAHSLDGGVRAVRAGLARCSFPYRAVEEWPRTILPFRGTGNVQIRRSPAVGVIGATALGAADLASSGSSHWRSPYLGGERRAANAGVNSAPFLPLPGDPLCQPPPRCDSQRRRFRRAQVCEWVASTSRAGLLERGVRGGSISPPTTR